MYVYMWMNSKNMILIWQPFGGNVTQLSLDNPQVFPYVQGRGQVQSSKHEMMADSQNPPVTGLLQAIQ